ncbi:MAG: hypothetical protein ACLFT1_03970 [Desulfonatronovibrio sp.]
MTLITGSSFQNPVQQYARVENKTSGSIHRHETAKVSSVQKSTGFRWKNMGIEYQTEDIHVQPGTRTARTFIHEMREAREIQSLTSHKTSQNFSRHYGPHHPRSAATAYEAQARIPLDYSRPMLNMAV